MRQLRFGTLTIAAIIAIGGAAYALQATDQYRIIPGPVTGSYKDGINGTFRLEAVASGGLMSEGHGGACIIFRAEDVGFSKMAQKSCTADGDCATEETPGQNVHGYCDVQTSKCWARPTKMGADDALCEKSLQLTPPTPWTPGVDNKISAEPIKIKSLGVRKHAQARVVTCLHGIPVGGCFDPNLPAKSEWGDPTPL